MRVKVADICPLFFEKDLSSSSWDQGAVARGIFNGHQVALSCSGASNG